VLVADCVTKSFGDRRVLSAGSLRAVPGQVRVILGRNGVGKSTLMKITCGWISADSGIVQLDGRTILRPSLPALARSGVFYLPDHALFSASMPLGQQLGFFEKKFGARSAKEGARLARVDHLLGQHPDTLSGGELRRAELAAVLTRRPRCLIADEPYRGIAPVDHDLLSEILVGMAADGCAVVLSGHDVASLLDAAHHVTWCVAGTTVELGHPDVARANDGFRRDYLGPALAPANWRR
jgi:ABC-type multidrug transport system ATPase subunit